MASVALGGRGGSLPHSPKKPSFVTPLENSARTIMINIRANKITTMYLGKENTTSAQVLPVCSLNLNPLAKMALLFEKETRLTRS
jgi:hypothetical protein